MLSYIDQAVSFTFFEDKYLDLMRSLAFHGAILLCIFLVIVFIYSTFTNFLPTIIGCLVIALFLSVFVTVTCLVLMALMCPVYGVSIWIKVLLVYLMPNINGALASILAAIISTTIFVGSLELMVRLKNK